MNTFFKLQINNPIFEEQYNKYKKLVEETIDTPPSPNKISLKEIKEIFRIQLNSLIIHNSFIIGQLIDTEKHISKPLLERGLSNTEIANGIRKLKEDKYLDYYPEGKNTHMGFMLSAKGYEWAEDINEKDNQENLNNNSYRKYNFFTISKGHSPKIRKLLEEINDLPKDSLNNFYNLIAHQLRTVFALLLIEYWENNEKPLQSENKEGLNKIINYTIQNAKTEKLKKADYVVKELEDIKSSKTKELCDDVVHCSYSLIAEGVILKFLNSISHLLSLIYGR